VDEIEHYLGPRLEIAGVARISAEAVRAATETGEDDEGKLFADDQHAAFTACLDARRAVAPGAQIDLAVDHKRFHFFDPGTGLALDTAARASLVA